MNPTVTDIVTRFCDGCSKPQEGEFPWKCSSSGGKWKFCSGSCMAAFVIRYVGISHEDMLRVHGDPFWRPL